jgi:hypothetical protein
MACDAEMILMKIAEDESKPVAEFEFGVCLDTEQCLVFHRPAKESDAETAAYPTRG